MDLATLMAFKREMMQQLNTISATIEQRTFAVNVIDTAYMKLVDPQSQPQLLVEDEQHF